MCSNRVCGTYADPQQTVDISVRDTKIVCRSVFSNIRFLLILLSSHFSLHDTVHFDEINIGSQLLGT